MSACAGLPVSGGESVKCSAKSSGGGDGALFSPPGAITSQQILQLVLWVCLHFPLHFFKNYLKLIVILYLGHFHHWSLMAVLRPLSGDSSLIAPSSSVISLISMQQLDLQSLDLVSRPGPNTHLPHDSGQTTSVHPPYPPY